MSDSIWLKVSELTKGYPSEFNAGAVYDLVKEAWRMGFDVIPVPKGSDLYNIAMHEIAINIAQSQ
jgi:hypothetical protein